MPTTFLVIVVDAVCNEEDGGLTHLVHRCTSAGLQGDAVTEVIIFPKIIKQGIKIELTLS